MTRAALRTMNRGFTLIELLVTIGVITILATITVVAVNAVSREAKLSSGVNTVIAALGQARALAMKNNQLVLVVFRANWDDKDPERRQVTEIITAQWTGELRPKTNPDRYEERYVQMPESGARSLPEGIKVAGPWYDFAQMSFDSGFDELWITQPELRRTNPQAGSPESEGRMIGIMFAPDGTVITRNPATAALQTVAYVDFDNDGSPDFGTTTAGGSGANKHWFYDEPGDDPYVNFVSFLSVYDDDAAREAYGDDDWSNPNRYEAELQNADQTAGLDPQVGYIAQFANRIHFNRYSGVAMTDKGEGG